MARLLACFIFFCTAALVASARANADELRDFDVRVDGQLAGLYRLNIAADPQGRILVTGHADVRVKHLLFPYTYVFSGSELWQEARLLSFQGESVDGGKKSQVSALFAPAGARISVNGRSHAGKPCAWTTTFWQLPQTAPNNPSLPLLDVDTGRELEARLERLGQHQMVVGGQTLTVQRYRLSGAMPAELWFDDSRRLVRQESMDDGHRIEWVLKDLRTNAAP
jgi:hypothetical protein